MHAGPLLNRRAAAAVILSAGLPVQRAWSQDAAFGLLLPSRAVDYFARMASGASQEAEKIAIKLSVFDYQFEPATLIAKVQDAIVSGYAGLAIAVSNFIPEELLRRIIQPAMDSGIPLVTIGKSVEGANGSITPDLAAAGALQAGIAIKAVSQGSALYFTSSDQSAIDGFKKGVAGKLSVSQIAIAGFEPDRIETATNGAIGDHPDVTIIAASSDAFAVPAAIDAASKGTKAYVIGLGASPDGVAAVESGKLLATIDLRPDLQGAAAVRSLDGIRKHICHNGQKPPCPPGDNNQVIQPEPVVAKGGQ